MSVFSPDFCGTFILLLFFLLLHLKYHLLFNCEAFGRVQCLLLEVVEAARLPHIHHAKEEAEKGQPAEVPDRPVDLHRGVDHELEGERDDDQVKKLGTRREARG